MTENGKNYVAYIHPGTGRVAIVNAPSLEIAKASVVDGATDIIELPEDWVGPSDPSQRNSWRIVDGEVVVGS